MMVKPLHVQLKSIVLSLFCATGFILAGTLASDAADLVSGNYSSSGGTNIVLDLVVRTPAPSNLIVEQYISPANNITATSPPARKINPANGEVKWLIRNIQSGHLSLSMHLGSPLKGDVRAVVRYRDPRSGQFSELAIAPHLPPPSPPGGPGMMPPIGPTRPVPPPPGRPFPP